MSNIIEIVEVGPRDGFDEGLAQDDAGLLLRDQAREKDRREGGFHELQPAAGRPAAASAEVHQRARGDGECGHERGVAPRDGRAVLVGPCGIHATVVPRVRASSRQDRRSI